jgi:ubiquinone/menaquinone biosynthesis C-methylase UbiE
MAPSRVAQQAGVPEPSGLPDTENLAWTIDGVLGQYSYSSAHSDLYRYLTQWADFSAYLNVGYSRRGQKHEHPATHLRLIDRVATGLLELHARGPFAEDMRLLDIASGRGGPALYAHQKYGLDVTGIDVTPYNVGRAIRNTRAIKADRSIRFCMGRAEALPVASSSFSLGWSIESPAHFPDKSGFIREAARVLNPGGAFAFADLLVADWRATASAKNRRIYEEFLRVWDVPNLQTLRSYQKTIADSGFDLRDFELAKEFNLRIFERYCRPFLLVNGIPVVFGAYQQFVKWRTGADLTNVYEHVLRSFDALRLGMIDYGIFWMIRR